MNATIVMLVQDDSNYHEIICNMTDHGIDKWQMNADKYCKSTARQHLNEVSIALKSRFLIPIWDFHYL